MKTLIVLLAFTITSAQCVAQFDDNKMLYLAKAEKYRKMKSTGQVLTFGGTAMAVIGMVMLSNVETTTNSYGQTTSTGNVGGGIALYLLGTCAVGAGVPLWIVGGINKGRYERKLESVSVKLNLSPQHNGVAIRYRF